MLFPTVDRQLIRIIIGFTLGLAVTAVVVIGIGLGQTGQFAAMATATPTKTPTKKVTVTPTASPTDTLTPTPTETHTPTSAATPTKTATPTPTPVPPSPTPIPPTPTLPPAITDTPTVTQTEIIEATDEPTLAVTLALTQTSILTGTEVITPVGTPTPTPTPVPRTVMVPTDIPDYAEVEDHFWFTRPFTDAYLTWGSYYYPYGTSGRGQYFWHHGIDIQNPHGTTIVAVGDGTVTHAGPDDAQLLGLWLDFYGQAVVIRHDRDWEGLPVYTLYGHVSKVLVQEGQQVKTGDPIAEVGQLGVALGPHLHLEVRLGAATYFNTRNPDLWMRPDFGFGVIAGRVVDYQNYYVPQQLVTLHRASEPGRFWRETFTYPDGDEVSPDETYVETFTFSDVPVGSYLIKTFFDGRQLTVPITVTNRATTFVLLQQTQPPPTPKPPTPTPAAPPTDSLPPEGESTPTAQP